MAVVFSLQKYRFKTIAPQGVADQVLSYPVPYWMDLTYLLAKKIYFFIQKYGFYLYPCTIKNL